MSLMLAGRELPAPGDRVSVELWKELRAWLIANDPDAAPMADWSTSIVVPADAERLAGEIVWIILCAGKTAQAARTLEARCWAAIHEGRPVLSAFGHRMRAGAIEFAWAERRSLFAKLAEMRDAPDEDLLAWCRSLPGVGPVTCYQLAKNLGRDLAKPDIWLCRLAGIPDRPGGRVAERFAACRDLCIPLARATGDRIATVDSMLWLACNKGILSVDARGGPIAYRPNSIRARPIMSGFGFTSEAGA